MQFYGADPVILKSYLDDSAWKTRSRKDVVSGMISNIRVAKIANWAMQL